MTISDHLDWQSNVTEHLSMLQEKLNVYLAFVESGELLETYPDAEGREIVFSIVGKHALSDEARQFVEKASAIIQDAGMRLEFELFQES